MEREIDSGAGFHQGNRANLHHVAAMRLARPVLDCVLAVDETITLVEPARRRRSQRNVDVSGPPQIYGYARVSTLQQARERRARVLVVIGAPQLHRSTRAGATVPAVALARRQVDSLGACRLPDHEVIMRLRAGLDRVSVTWRQHERAA